MSRNSLSNSSLLGREEEQGWPWVWELIGRPRPETHQRLRIRVADTVIFRDGYPRTWVAGAPGRLAKRDLRPPHKD